MKRILSAILLVITSTSLVACGFFSNDVCKYEDLFKGEIHGARNNVFTYTDEDTTRIKETVESIQDSIDANHSALSLTLKFNSFFSEMTYVNEQFVVINLYASMFPNNEDIIEDLTFIKTFYLELAEHYYEFLIAFMNSEHKDTFFNGWSDEDFEFLIQREELYDDEYYALEQKQATLDIEYTILLSQPSFDLEAISKKVVEIVNIDNEIANKLGYDNYLDYMYEGAFNREYEYEDLSIMRTSAKSNASEVLTLLDNEISELSNSTISSLLNLTNGSYFDNKDNFESLAKYMGGDYEKYFNHFWDSGEYYFGNEQSSAGAFVQKTLSSNFIGAYFGPGSYSSLSTVVHEVGHYMAGCVDYTDGSFDNIDLAEAQAQSNEMLMAAYMLDTNDNDINNAYATYQLYTGVSVIISGLLVADFEYELYTKNNLVYTDVSSIMSNIYDEYNVNDIFRDSDDYWPRVFAYTSGYYISYAVSVVPALELFFEAVDDLDKAKADYMIILNGQNQLLNVIDTLGYSSPIDTNIIEVICNKIKNFIA